MNKKTLELYASVYKEDNYPPIAGKVIGLFYISEKKYFDFDEIMKGVSASKGATSKALNFLLELGEVAFTMAEENKRKRMFYLKIGGGVRRLERIIMARKLETQLLKETQRQRSGSNHEMDGFIQEVIAFNEDILHFIEQKIGEHFRHRID